MGFMYCLYEGYVESCGLGSFDMCRVMSLCLQGMARLGLLLFRCTGVWGVLGFRLSDLVPCWDLLPILPAEG